MTGTRKLEFKIEPGLGFTGAMNDARQDVRIHGWGLDGSWRIVSCGRSGLQGSSLLKQPLID